MLRRSGYNDAIGRSKRDQKIDSEEIVKLLRPFERRLAPDEHSPPFAPTTSASLPMSRALTLPANTPLDAERLDDVDEILSNEQRFADKLAATAVDNGRQNSPAETTAMHRCAIRGSLDLYV